MISVMFTFYYCVLADAHDILGFVKNFPFEPTSYCEAVSLSFSNITFSGLRVKFRLLNVSVHGH